MNDEGKNGGTLADDFRRLGENFQSAMQTAWESEERKDLTREIKEGIQSVSDAIERTADQITESPKAQQLKAEIDELAERVRSGELTTKLREDLSEVLQKINAWLEQVGGGTPSEGSSEDTGA
jgi:vacuolar-type H+-ATPase subunit E/Vma4